MHSYSPQPIYSNHSSNTSNHIYIVIWKQCRTKYRKNYQPLALLENPLANGPDIGTDVQADLDVPKKSTAQAVHTPTITTHL